MKIFGYKSNSGEYSDYGITCGIVIAESEEEAKDILGYDEWEGRKIFEIPFEKGYTLIGTYGE